MAMKVSTKIFVRETERERICVCLCVCVCAQYQDSHIKVITVFMNRFISKYHGGATSSGGDGQQR